MKIVDGSVKNIDHLFEKLILDAGGANYSLDFEGRIFRYQEDSNFTIETLQRLYEGESRYLNYKEPLLIDGPIDVTNFDLIKRKVYYYLTLASTGDPRGYEDLSNRSILWSVKPEVAKQRFENVLGIINAHFTLPPTRCFEHKPENDSFFGGWDMWVFCYILLNENTQEGIFITGQAYD
jgi:hypothetical protein